MAKRAVDANQMNELLYQSLETELGGVQIYETAVQCAINEDLRHEFEEYLEQTRRHVEVMTQLIEGLGLDPATETPGRAIVRHLGESLVAAMRMALKAGEPAAAQLVATECVLLAETKDHANWELIGLLAEKGHPEGKALLKQAYDEVEKEEDHHLYHTKGWSRELWIESLGLPAALPPPEEVKLVETAIGAARAEQARDEMTSRKH